MTATMTTAAGILKEVYEGDVNDQVQNDVTFSKRIEQSSEDIFETPGGKYVVFPLRTKRNHGISYRDENTQLAPARRQGYAQAVETLRYGYGRVRITGQLMELASTNEHSFMNGATAEIDGMKDDIARDVNRIMVGNRAAFNVVGATGIITRVTGNSTGTSITVADTFQVEVDMLIDIVDNSGVPVAGGTGRVVTSITSATVFVVDAAVAGSVTGNNVCRTGNFNKEPYGILPLVDSSGTVHGINSATAGNEYWQATVDTSTTTLTEGAMIGMVDNVRKKSGKYPTAVFCSLGVRRAYFNLLTTLRRYNEPKQWTGGLVGLAFNGGKEMPVVDVVDFPLKHMLMLDETEIKIYRPRPWYWADKDGDMFKWVNDYDAWEALMKQYWQVVTHRRNAHGLFTNITEG